MRPEIKKWTRRDVLEFSHLYGAVKTSDGWGTKVGRQDAVCQSLVQDKYMDVIGPCTYQINDRGRRYVVMGER